METRLVKVVVEIMGDVFPELRQHEVHIRDIIAEEEASFGKTLLNVSLSSVHTVFGFYGSFDLHRSSLCLCVMFAEPFDFVDRYRTRFWVLN